MSTLKKILSVMVCSFSLSLSLNVNVFASENVQESDARIRQEMQSPGFHVNKNVSWKGDNWGFNAPILSWAAYKGDLELVKSLLARGADLFAKDYSGDTALIFALYSHQTEVAEYLLSQGANPHEVNSDKQNALSYAVQAQSIPLVKQLLESGVDPELKDYRDGKNSLLYGIETGNLDLVKVLLEHGLDPNSQDDDRASALIYASRSNHPSQIAMVELLLKSGADLSSESKLGETCLSAAVRQGNLELVKLFLDRGMNIHWQNKYQNNLLMEAVESENLDLVKFLINKGLNPKHQNGFGMNLLHYAVQHHQIEIYDYLKNLGLDPGQLDQEGQLPLAYASYDIEPGHFEHLLKDNPDSKQLDIYLNRSLFQSVRNKPFDPGILKYLLQKGINVDARQIDEEYPTLAERYRLENNPQMKHATHGTPLMEAARRNNFEAVKFLLEAGADPNQSQSNGYTALMHAIESKDSSIQVIEILLKYGANPNAVLLTGETPLLLTFGKFVDTEAFPVLLKHGANPHAIDKSGQSILFKATQTLYENPNEHKVTLLFDAGVKFHEDQHQGQALVQWALKTGNVKVFEQLMAAGITLPATDEEGNTALMFAAEGGNLELVKRVLTKGVNPQAINNNDEDAIYYAVIGGNPETISLLVTKGVQLNRTNSENNALQLATERDDFEMVRFLISKGANPNIYQEDTLSPLKYAAQNIQGAHVELLQYFLDKGMNPNDGLAGDSSLELAAEKGHVNLMKILLDRGAKLCEQSSENIDQESALRRAINNKHIQAAQLLFDRSALNCLTEEAQTDILSEIISQNHIFLLKSYLQSAARFHKQPSQNDLLKLTLEHDSLKIFKYLQQQGLDLKQVDQEGNTLLIRSARYDSKKISSFLIQSGLDINARNKKGESALMTAVKSDLNTQIDFLLKQGADPNLSNAEGTNALILAVQQVSMECVRLLLNSRLTDREHRDLKGKTALDYARQLQDPHLIDLLMDY